MDRGDVDDSRHKEEPSSAAENIYANQPPSSQPSANPHQPSNYKPSDDQPSDNHHQASNKQPSDNQPSDNQPSDNQPSDNQPSDNQPSDNQPSDNQPSDNQPSDNPHQPSSSTGPYVDSKEERREKLNILDELGGPQGIADSSIPGIAFALFYSLQRDIKGAVIVAIALSVILTIIRLRRGESLKFVLFGLIGIVVAGLIASRTGKAENFFLPGILLNGLYSLVYLLSIAVRWPLVGVILELAGGRGNAWRKDREKMKVYSLASYPWVLLFASRFAVQFFFYLSGAVVALSLVRTAMGLPLFILTVWLTWRILKKSGIEMPNFLNVFAKKKSGST